MKRRIDLVDQVLYGRLVSEGKEGNLPTYSDIAVEVNLDTKSPDDLGKLDGLLQEIDAYEHEHGRPLLSSIVVIEGDRVPRAAYFESARSLGKLKRSGKMAEMDFWVIEVNAVYRAWGG